MSLQSVQTRSITQALAEQAGGHGAISGKSLKYPTFKKLVMDTIETYPPETRLPPVRSLAESLGISLVTAQRVVTELIAEGVVYSQPRIGVFVADRNARPSSQDSSRNSKKLAADSFADRTSFQSRFRFATESGFEFQRLLWSTLVGKFSSRYPNTQAELTFVSDPTDPARALDVYERLGWNVSWSGDENRLLDLRSFAPDEIAARCTEQGTLPLYYRSNFLFFNPALLERCRIPAPTYQDFAGQLAYLRETGPILEQHGFDPRLFAVQQPVTVLGCDNLENFFSLIYKDQSESRLLQDFTAAAESTLELCRINRRAPGFQNPQARAETERFMAGHEPFFLGHSVDYWEFGQRSPRLDFQCVPTLCADDSIFLWPMVGCVNQSSRRPAESIRFLSYLTSPGAQAEFAKTGCFPSNVQAGESPPMQTDAEWLARTLANSQPIHLATQDRFYLAINVLNNELWHALLDHASAEEAVNQAIHLGRSYLRQHPTLLHADT